MTSLKYGALVPMLLLSCAQPIGRAPVPYLPFGCDGHWEALERTELEALAGQYDPFELSYSVSPEDFAEEGPWMVSTFVVSIHPTFKDGRRFFPLFPEQPSRDDETVKCGEVTVTQLQVESHSDIFTDGMCMGEMTHTLVDGKHDQTDWFVSLCPYAHLTYEETSGLAEREGLSLYTDWPRHVSHREPTVSIFDQKNNMVPLVALQNPHYGLGMSYLRKVETREYHVAKSIERGTITRVSE